MHPLPTHLQGMSWLFLCCLPLVLSLRSLFDQTNLPRLADTDSIELYHLRSFPAMLIDTAAGTFSTQTSGLALRSTMTNLVIVLEYKPKSYSGCFLPIIEAVHEGNYALYWDKRAELLYHDQIDTVYWQQSTFLAHINGIVYKNYVMWIDRYMQSNRVFSPQSVCNSEHEYACYSNAETWETFLQDSLQVFAAFSVRIHAIIPPRATELRLLSSTEPVMIQAQKVVPALESSSSEGRRRHDNNGNGVMDSQPLHPSSPSPSNPSAVGNDDYFYFDDDAPVVGNGIRRESGLRAHIARQVRQGGDGYEDLKPTARDANYVTLPKVAMEEIVDYYQELMSCMQGESPL